MLISKVFIIRKSVSEFLIQFIFEVTNLPLRSAYGPMPSSLFIQTFMKISINLLRPKEHCDPLVHPSWSPSFLSLILHVHQNFDFQGVYYQEVHRDFSSISFSEVTNFPFPLGRSTGPTPTAPPPPVIHEDDSTYNSVPLAEYLFFVLIVHYQISWIFVINRVPCMLSCWGEETHIRGLH